MKKLFALLAFGMLVAGCQNGDQYLHHIPNPHPEVFNFTHKLKELQGETRVDILMVFDNSASMGGHQQAVIKNSDLFIQEFVKKQKVLDWKLGLISTAKDEKPYLGFDPGTFLDRTTANPAAVFNGAVGKLGTNGDATERPWASIQSQLMKYPTWVRKGAILAIIVITDAEEQSQMPATDFLKFLVQMKGSAQQLVHYGVYGPEEWNCPKTGDSAWNYTGSPYETLAAALPGKKYSLCGDFGANLADLGQDLVKRVKSPRIALTLRPQIETIQVRHKGDLLKGGPKDGPEKDRGLWQYDFDLNAIVFHDLDFAEEENEEVVISYEEAVKARSE